MHKRSKYKTLAPSTPRSPTTKKTKVGLLAGVEQGGLPLALSRPCLRRPSLASGRARLSAKEEGGGGLALRLVSSHWLLGFPFISVY